MGSSLSGGLIVPQGTTSKILEAGSSILIGKGEKGENKH